MTEQITVHNNDPTMFELEDASLRYRIDNEIGVLIKFDEQGRYCGKEYPPEWHEQKNQLEIREKMREIQRAEATSDVTATFKRYGKARY